MLRVIAGRQLADHHTLGAGCVDHLSVTDINTHMGHTLSVCILQKDQITGLQVCFRNIGSQLHLFGGGSGQLNAALRKYILDQTGAVEAFWAGAAPDIGDTQVLFRIGNDLLSGDALPLQGGGTGGNSGGFAVLKEQGFFAGIGIFVGDFREVQVIAADISYMEIGRASCRERVYVLV